MVAEIGVPVNEGGAGVSKDGIGSGSVGTWWLRVK